MSQEKSSQLKGFDLGFIAGLCIGLLLALLTLGLTIRHMQEEALKHGCAEMAPDPERRLFRWKGDD